MKQIRAELLFTYKMNHSHDVPACVNLTVMDTASGITLLDTELSSGQLLALLASAPIQVDANVPRIDLDDRVGKTRVHEQHFPDDDRNFDVNREVTYEMIEYADIVRHNDGWDSATWHKHQPDNQWCLHLVRWE